MLAELWQTPQLLLAEAASTRRRALPFPSASRWMEPPHTVGSQQQARTHGPGPALPLHNHTMPLLAPHGGGERAATPPHRAPGSPSPSAADTGAQMTPPQPAAHPPSPQGGLRPTYTRCPLYTLGAPPPPSTAANPLGGRGCDAPSPN